MSWYDDFESRVSQFSNSAVSSAKDYFANAVVSEAVKVGSAASGNLSEAELRAGKRGNGQPIVGLPNSNPSLNNAKGVSQLSWDTSSVSQYLPYFLAAAAAYLIFSKKGRV